MPTTEERLEAKAKAEALEAWEVGVHDCITPQGLNHLFDMAVKGEQDIDPREVLFLMFADVIDSAVLSAKHAIADAFKSIPHIEPLIDAIGDEITVTVNDYVGNHYGD